MKSKCLKYMSCLSSRYRVGLGKLAEERDLGAEKD